MPHCPFIPMGEKQHGLVPSGSGSALTIKERYIITCYKGEGNSSRQKYQEEVHNRVSCYPSYICIHTSLMPNLCHNASPWTTLWPNSLELDIRVVHLEAGECVSFQAQKMLKVYAKTWKAFAMLQTPRRSTRLRSPVILDRALAQKIILLHPSTAFLSVEGSPTSPTAICTDLGSISTISGSALRTNACKFSVRIVRMSSIINIRKSNQRVNWRRPLA